MSEINKLDWQGVSSSNLNAIAFQPTADDPGFGDLFVRFKSGLIWRYHVPEELVTELLEAESAGTFFARHIRGGYTGTKVEEAGEEAPPAEPIGSEPGP